MFWKRNLRRNRPWHELINGRQLEQKLASKQRTSSVRCKVIELVWALKYIAGVPHRNQKAAVRWLSMILCVIDTKGCQLELLTLLLSTVVGLCWKEAEQRTLISPRLAHLEPLRIGFLVGSTYYLLLNKAGPEAFSPFTSVSVASSQDRPCPSCQTSDAPRKLSG